MSDRTQQARERAAEIIEALDEQDITWHSQGPWEHLGDGWHTPKPAKGGDR